MLHLSRPPTPKVLVITGLCTFLLGVVYFVHLHDYRLPVVSDALVSVTTGLGKTPPVKAPDSTAINVSDSAPKDIPEKIWYKLGPKGLNDEADAWISTCTNQNPRHRVELMTDESSDAYVQKTFAARPDIVETYFNLTVPILRADLLRYLLLYAEGGMWSDLDVSCEGVPIADWIPAEYRNRTELVVGWEFDVGWGPIGIGQRQFATWAILSRPGLAHMKQVVEDIVEGVRVTAAVYKVPVSGLDMKMVGDVVDFTGPRRFTRSVFKSLQATIGREVDVGAIAEIRQPQLVENVLILPGFAFANATNFYNEGEVVGPVLVTHHYAGSWKNEFGGEKVDRRAAG